MPPPRCTLFPYTTLFRSLGQVGRRYGKRSEDGPHVGRPSRQRGKVRRRSNHHRVRQSRRSEHRAALRRSEEHTSELQSLTNLVCRLLLEKKKNESTPEQG